MRQSLTELTGTLNDWQAWQLTKIKTEPIRQLLTCGLSIQVAAGGSDVTPFDDARTLRTFLADHAFGKLRQDILHLYPGCKMRCRIGPSLWMT